MSCGGGFKRAQVGALSASNVEGEGTSEKVIFLSQRLFYCKILSAKLISASISNPHSTAIMRPSKVSLFFP